MKKVHKKVVSNIYSICSITSWDFSHLHSCCTLQVVHSMLLSVLHSLAHPVGRTTSVEHRDVCCWVCVYEMLLVLSRLFTPPGGHSLYHNTCWPLWRPAGPTAWMSNSRKSYRFIRSLSSSEIYTSCRTNFYKDGTTGMIWRILLKLTCFSIWRLWTKRSVFFCT